MKFFLLLALIAAATASPQGLIQVYNPNNPAAGINNGYAGANNGWGYNQGNLAAERGSGYANNAGGWGAQGSQGSSANQYGASDQGHLVAGNQYQGSGVAGHEAERAQGSVLQANQGSGWGRERGDYAHAAGVDSGANQNYGRKFRKTTVSAEDFGNSASHNRAYNVGRGSHDSGRGSQGSNLYAAQGSRGREAGYNAQQGSGANYLGAGHASNVYGAGQAQHSQGAAGGWGQNAAGYNNDRLQTGNSNGYGYNAAQAAY